MLLRAASTRSRASCTPLRPPGSLHTDPAAMMAAARAVRAPVAPAPPRRARSLRALVVARSQRPPVQAPSDPNAALQAVVRALETAAVIAAVGVHLAATAAAVRQQRQAAAPTPQRWQQQQLDEQRGSQRVAHAAAAAPPPVPQWLAAPQAGWASPSGLWLTLPLLAALVLGRIRAWLSGSRCAPQSAVGVGGVERWRVSTLPAVQPDIHSARLPLIHAGGELSDRALKIVCCPLSAPRRVSTEAAARLLRAEAAAGQQAQRIEELARQVGTR